LASGGNLTLNSAGLTPTGALQIDSLGTGGGDIVTNDASVKLTGTGADFVDAHHGDVLTKIAANAASGSFALAGGANFTTARNFTNGGALAIGLGTTFAVSGKLNNFARTTLTGDSRTVGGTLKFAGANVVDNDAAIALTGTGTITGNSQTRNRIFIRSPHRRNHRRGTSKLPVRSAGMTGRGFAAMVCADGRPGVGAWTTEYVNRLMRIAVRCDSSARSFP
jgi:hypothetical protein